MKLPKLQGKSVYVADARRLFLTILAVTALLSGLPSPIHGEPSPNDHDLSAQETLFENYNKNFTEMGKALPNDWQVSSFGDIANTAEQKLLDSDLILQIYDRISCQADRGRVRGIVKAQLHSSAWWINTGALRVSTGLLLAKSPGDAELYIHFRDDLMVAKAKLDKISDSLN